MSVYLIALVSINYGAFQTCLMNLLNAWNHFAHILLPLYCIVIKPTFILASDHHFGDTIYHLIN